MRKTAMRKYLGCLLFCVVTYSTLLSAQGAKEKYRTMEQDGRQYGKLNPKAPVELARWAFLVGDWAGEAKLKREGGRTETLQVSWDGRYILDGYAIEDEYRMTTATGELVVLGTNIRAYDAQKKVWSMKWLNAISGTWTDLGSEELGGWRVDEKTFSYDLKESTAGHVLTRATYTNISSDHFSWRGEKSNDGKGWEEFLIVDLYRRKN
jgi:hypothetical protein